MSNKMLKSYTGFNREILSEVMSKAELEAFDDLYNYAKFLKAKRLYRKMIGDKLRKINEL